MGVSLIIIEDKHAQNPASFADESLPKDQQVNFCIADGKICCPIDKIFLDVGRIALITDCCKSVFAGSGFSRHVETYKNCYYCQTALDPDNVRRTNFQLGEIETTKKLNFIKTELQDLKIQMQLPQNLGSVNQYTELYRYAEFYRFYTE